MALEQQESNILPRLLENSKTFCFVCFEELKSQDGINLQDKFDEDGGATLFVTLNNIYCYIQNNENDLNLFINKNWPKKVCNNCLSDLQNTFKFIQKIVNSFKDNYLNKLNEDENTCRVKLENYGADNFKYDNRHYIKFCVVCLKTINRRFGIELETKYKGDKLTTLILMLNDIYSHFHNKTNAEILISNRNKRQYVCKCCWTDLEKTFWFMENVVNAFENQLLNKTDTPVHTGYVPWTKKKYIRKKNFICENCSKAFASNWKLMAHCRVHTKEKPYSCDLCDARFSGKGKLESHFKEHTGFKEFFCDICNKTYANRGNFVKHETTHFTKDELKCDYCKVLFKTRHLYLKHLQTKRHSKNKFGLRHKFPSKSTQLCHLCGKCLSSTTSLKEHLQMHSSTRPLKCNLCPKTFTHSYSLVIHKRIHLNIKPYKCEICDKSFSEYSYWKHHYKTHTKEKPFGCNFCDKKFALKQALKQHLRVHTRERPYSCPVCKKTFRCTSNMRVHYFSHKQTAIPYSTRCGTS